MDNSLQICVCMCVFPACWRETAVTSCHVSKAVMDKPGLFLHFPCQSVPHCLLETIQYQAYSLVSGQRWPELMITFEFVIGCNQCRSDDSMGSVKRNIKSPIDPFSSSSCSEHFSPDPILWWVLETCHFRMDESVNISRISQWVGESWSVYPVRQYIAGCQWMSAVRDASCLYCF